MSIHISVVQIHNVDTQTQESLEIKSGTRQLCMQLKVLRGNELLNQEKKLDHEGGSISPLGTGYLCEILDRTEHSKAWPF